MLLLDINACCCTFPWWLYWLLPFLLGLALGWLLWGRYKKMIADLETQISGLKRDIDGYLQRIAELEAQLNECNDARAALGSDIARYKGQLEEMGQQQTLGFVATPDAPGDDPHPYIVAVGQDNLQIIEGIGPKLSALLRDNGIKTWAALGNETPESLRALLDRVDRAKFRIKDPSSWPEQSRLANQGRWDELIDLQKRLDGGKYDSDKLTDSKFEKLLIKKGLIKKWELDDLTAIEGIGPKTSELLKAKGIHTWQTLSETSVNTLQDILNEAGARFKLSDPGTWPKQAGMAARGEWDELKKYQDFLDGGKE